MTKLTGSLARLLGGGGCAVGVGLLALVSVTSCGGGGASTCSMATPCGGDIVGNWRVTSACLKVTGTLDSTDCTTGSPTLDANLEVTGTASFTSNLNYTLALVINASETINFPASCLMSSGVTTTCDQLNQAFAGQPPDPSVTSIHCNTASGGGCNCLAVLAPTSSDETGTYVIAGTTVTTTTAGSTTANAPSGFCVKGTQLDLPLIPDMSDPNVTETGNLTFTRQ